MENEINVILPKFPENRKENRGICAILRSGSIGLAYEGISSFLHNRRHKTVRAIDRQSTTQGQTFTFRRFYGNVWHS